MLLRSGRALLAALLLAACGQGPIQNGGSVGYGGVNQDGGTTQAGAAGQMAGTGQTAGTPGVVATTGAPGPTLAPDATFAPVDGGNEGTRTAGTPVATPGGPQTTTTAAAEPASGTPVSVETLTAVATLGTAVPDQTALPVAGSMGVSSMNMFALANTSAQNSTFLDLIRTMEMERELEDANLQKTVFIPTNLAFSALPNGTLQILRANPERLRSILRYHIAEGRVLSTEITGQRSVTTSGGATLMLQLRDGALRINDAASVIDRDLIASNGVVHTIDQILLPPGVVISTANP